MWILGRNACFVPDAILQNIAKQTVHSRRGHTMRASFDFETWEWVNPLACGIMWGSPGAREHVFIRNDADPDTVIREVLVHMAALVSLGDVSEFWAHNGGKFDALFLAKGAADLGWSMSAHMAGTRVIYLGIKAGKGKDAPLIRIFDSYSVAQASLKQNAIDWELPSRKLFTEDDYSKDTRTWAPDRLKEGCLVDCQLVLELLEKVEAQVTQWGGELRTTFSSTALTVLKASLAEDGLEIPSHAGLEEWQDIARQSYCGGRVEVLHHAPQWKLIEHDVCSSYPWSMSQTLPWEPLGQATNTKAIERILAGEREGIIHAEVTVDSCYLPPLPFIVPKKLGGGLFFPTGTWQAWFAAPELRYARKLGVRMKLLDAIGYMPKKPYAGIIGKIYTLKATSTGAVRQFCKLMLNGGYGKHAQAPERQTLKCFGTEEEALHYLHRQKEGSCANISTDRRFLVQDTFRWPKHSHFAAASYITANSRVLLHKAMMATEGLAYVDTDCTHGRSLKAKPGVVIGKELGQFKVELSDYTGKYYAPKIYHLTESNGGEHFAAKGFTVHHAKKGDPVDADVFRKLVARETIERGIMRGLKGQIRHGNTPERIADKKVWAGKSAKRRPMPDGGTFPWNVNDLLAGSHLDAICPIL